MIENKQENISTGKTGEQVAANYLRNKGFSILEMNFKNNSGRRLGEVDIIARDLEQNEIVFVEVKTREYNKYKDTLPEENINCQKLHKLAKIATVYLRQNKLEDCNYRFDAVSIWLDYASRMAKIKHIPNIFL